LDAIRESIASVRAALRKQRIDGELLLKGVIEELLRNALELDARDSFTVVTAIKYLQQRSKKYQEANIQGKLLSFIPYSKH
jgi:hypothetical protein